MVSRLQNFFDARGARRHSDGGTTHPRIAQSNRYGPAPSVVRISNAARAKLTSRVRRISNRKAAPAPGL